jgi:UDP-N-acetylmuramate--alanine ligase
MRLAKARVHFIGVGGIGMCGLAELLHNLGATVTGSDASENAQTARLKQMGITVFFGHEAGNIGESDVVVFSSAVRESNVEYKEARRKKIPLIRRAEALAQIMNLKRGIAIGGTHGKTTTTSLTSSIFLAAGLDPTIIVGGRLDVIKSTAQLGKGDWLIAEADESDGSFTHLSPEIVIITNIDNDHLDYYKNFENLQAAFVDFASRIPFYGVAIICGDDAHLNKLFASFGKRWISYGTGKDNDYVLTKADGHWDVTNAGSKVGELRPAMPGLHNALNSLAAVLAGMQAGLSFEVCAKAIAAFAGVDRRFQHKATVRGVDFYDDYGHHPTEIRAVLQGFKEKFPARRLVTVFQPHRFSRTQICWNDFLTAFAQTDVLFLLDIYAAGEASIEGVTSSNLAKEIDHPDCRYLARAKDPALEEVKAFVKNGDILLTLGAGDISKLGDQMSEAMAKA